MSIHVCVRSSFPFMCICVHGYVSSERDTVQSAHCSLCQRVAQLSLSGRRWASAGLFSIVSAARACFPPLGVIQDWAVVHIQKWSFKPEGNPINSSEIFSILERWFWTPVSHSHKNRFLAVFTISHKCLKPLNALRWCSSRHRLSSKLSALQQHTSAWILERYSAYLWVSMCCV